MLMRKGKKWALSCVAVSAVVLTGISATTVSADEANSVTTTQSAGNQTEDSNTQTASTTQTTQNNNVTTQAANSEVQDGGHVSDDFPDVSNNALGYASKFHVFANEATLNAHTNGNVAVENLYGNVNFGTNVTDQAHLNTDISYVENVHNLANSSFVNKTDSRTNKVIFGTNNDVQLGNDNGNPSVNDIRIDHLENDEVYQDKGTNKYIDFAEEFQKLENKSLELSDAHTTVSIKNSDFPDRNQRVINLENYEPTNNQIVINLDSDVLEMDTPITIVGLSSDKGGTTVIINVDGKGVNPLNVNSQIKLIYNHGDGSDNTERPNQETEFFDDNHLLWNFYDSSATNNQYAGDIEINRPFQGSILAPDATINIHQNLDGNIIANKVNIIGGETHRWDLQDNSDIETEFEKPVTIPGEADWFPNEGEEKPDENDGSNIEEPDDEEELDIDENGNLVDPKDPDENDNGEDNSTTDPKDSDKDDNDGNESGGTITPDTDKDDSDSEKPTSDGNQNLITGGGSDGSQTDTNTEEGLLPNNTGNKGESETPTTGTTDESGTLPQTGEASSILATIAGIILIALGFLLKTIRIKKD